MPRPSLPAGRYKTSGSDVRLAHLLPTTAAIMSFLAPPGYQPVYGPSIPYLGPVYGGLREGASVYIQGSLPDNITRFFVNLLCGQSESSDIALHFNPRFDGWDKVVFNTRRNAAWDAEEKIRDVPFGKGESFEMVIACAAEGFQLKINGKDFHTFKYRLPVARVCGLQIGGDVSIQTINVIGAGGMAGGIGGVYPGGVAGIMGGGFPGSNLPPIPYTAVIPGGMFPKRTVIIRGLVPNRADRFSINFLASSSGDVTFHLNPRVKDDVVVRNSMMGGHWGQEERQLADNPFKEGNYFDMSIRCAIDRFKVFVNGQPLLDFAHRARAVNEVDKLEVKGDVQISYIHF
ncbi:galectin-6-like isoform X2 [Festucalex cinctus]